MDFTGHQIVKIAAGGSNSVAIDSDGRAYGWGDNSYGQLDTSLTQRRSPVYISGLANIADMSVGYAHILARDKGNNVYSAGLNMWGQLGNAGSVQYRAGFSPITSLGASVVMISAGYQHSVAIKSDGTVWGWGMNAYGNYGDGTTQSSSTPVAVAISNFNLNIADVPKHTIAGGVGHTVQVKSDGTVWAWGANYYGQLGDGTTINRSAAIQVNGITGIVSVAASDHTVALKSDGTVWVWGSNAHGQFGDGTTTNRSAPAMVNGLSNIVDIAVGGNHTVALKNDGTVWAWGYNQCGQLGDGTLTERYTPAQISGLSNIVSISAGGPHTFALRSDGTVWACGRNIYGELGDGTTTNQSHPVRISITDVISIANGNMHSMALKSDGTVWSWGYNSNGELGNGTTISSLTPIQVSGLSGVAAIATNGNATGDQSVAIKSDGIVWAWGNKVFGQLGDGTTINRSTPVQVIGLSAVTACTVGYNHSVVLKSDGTVWGWGSNDYGQLGDGTTTNESFPVWAPSFVLNLKYSDIPKQTIAAGLGHTVQVKSDGAVFAWGANSYGQLGDGTTTNNSATVQVNGLSGAVAVAAGNYHTVVLKADGTVCVWGCNTYGQFGDGTTIDKHTPVQVSGLANVVAVAAGGNHTVALKSDGSVWAWGYNQAGQLGDGSTTNRYTPAQISGLSNIVAIAAWGPHTFALKSNGTIWACGENINGELGDGSTVGRLTPTQICLPGIVSITVGKTHALARKSDGTAWAWGSNANGELGNGTTIKSPTPVQINGLTSVIAIVAGGSNNGDHSVAVKSDGSVWAWGYNASGQLGDGTTANRLIPVQVIGLFGVTAAASGLNHSIALKSDGTVWDWGSNSYGQLGDGTMVDKSQPVRVLFQGDIGLSVTSGNKYNVVLSSTGVVDSTKTFTVSYNPSQLQLIDLAAQTQALDTVVGAVPGTDLTITKNDTINGIITFKLSKMPSIASGNNGLLTIITLQAKFTGNTYINFTS